MVAIINKNTRLINKLWQLEKFIGNTPLFEIKNVFNKVV